MEVDDARPPAIGMIKEVSSRHEEDFKLPSIKKDNQPNEEKTVSKQKDN